jgi:phosphoribosyl 1,2-cyclic phosphodiesterase
MIVTLWGARGSISTPGENTIQYGGNTSCVEVRDSDDSLLILDAGTGIRKLGCTLDKKIKRADILLTHLHLDHIQGLGFFKPLYDSDVEVHIYGPANSNRDLRNQLSKYFSPPLFPVFIGDLHAKIYFHALPDVEFTIGNFRILGQPICHPGFTVGYRITTSSGVLAYLSDHEPALGVENFPLSPDWTSGYDLAVDADLLLHDTQYTEEEYPTHAGWGHSTIQQALTFALLTKVKKLVTFHHDPAHGDEELDTILAKAIATMPVNSLKVECGREGRVFKLPE